ncbi:MAG: hypothetical protein V1793_08515 [Pseudomonadota bacterium]
MKTGLLEKFETMMTAVAFAEQNDHDYAIQLMDSLNQKKNQNYSRKTKGARPETRPQMRA